MDGPSPRMESNGEPLKIHISKPCNAELQRLGGYITEERGEVEMKGEKNGGRQNGKSSSAIERFKSVCVKDISCCCYRADGLC